MLRHAAGFLNPNGHRVHLAAHFVSPQYFQSRGQNRSFDHRMFASIEAEHRTLVAAMNDVADGQRAQRVILPRLDLDGEPATTADQFVPLAEQRYCQAIATDRADCGAGDQFDIVCDVNDRSVKCTQRSRSLLTRRRSSAGDSFKHV